MKKYILGLLLISAFACNQKPGGNKSNVPVIGFADAFEDNTIAQARTGFTDALQKNGFDEKNGTVKIVYRNAQGDIPKLTQIIKYFIAEKVDVLATCPSLPTITALQNTKQIPVCMMVAPTPDIMKLNDAQGKAPKNLFGVGEDLGYIDTSFLLITKIVTPKASKLNVGIVYNQSEPQSVDAMQRIQKLAAANNINLVVLSVNASAEVQMVTTSLLSKKPGCVFCQPG